MTTFEETMAFLASKQGQEAVTFLKQKQERSKGKKVNVTSKKRYKPVVKTEKKGDDCE